MCCRSASAADTRKRGRFAPHRRKASPHISSVSPYVWEPACRRWTRSGPAFFTESDLARMPLLALHVALHVRAGRNHRVAHLVSVLQGPFGQGGSNPAAAQGVGYEGAIDVQRLLAQVHVRQIGTMTVHAGLELMTGLVMVDG